MDVDPSGLELLSREESVRLLESTTVGRVAFHADPVPAAIPVAYAMDGSSIVVCVPDGVRLDAGIGGTVTFEADALDDGEGRAWSVAVKGVTSDVADPGEALPPEAGMDWRRERFVRISLDIVSGRRQPAHASSPDGGAGAGAAGDGSHPAGPAAVAETHSGVVFFVGNRAYKLKKALDLGFLDFRTRAARLAACRREVALNRRLAPDVYLGVADLFGPDGRPCDHLVVMRRMPDDRRLASLVAAGAPVHEHLAALARLLARFHAAAVRSNATAAAAGADAVARRWEANAAEMAPFAGGLLDQQVADEVIELARRYVAGRRPLFASRVAEGRACDGHGDLLADDIFCLDDGPRVLDCLEFDDQLRFGDVLADVAFLAMDLERLGRPDLATDFLDEYRAASGDSWPTSLADHYVAYRAQVRAKVACLRWAQGDGASQDAARELLLLCRDRLRRGRVKLVLVGGLPGTGKSTVALGLGAPLGAVVLRSDEVRKDLAGVDALAHVASAPDEGLYEPSATDATYAELLERARDPLSLGHSAVLDATWRHPGWREAAAALAAEMSADLVELRCVTPLDVAIDRVSRRLATGADPSDATETVVRALAATDPPWTTATEVDTSGDAAAAVAAALAVTTGRTEEKDFRP